MAFAVLDKPSKGDRWYCIEKAKQGGPRTRSYKSYLNQPRARVWGTWEDFLWKLLSPCDACFRFLSFSLTGGNGFKPLLLYIYLQYYNKINKRTCYILIVRVPQDIYPPTSAATA